MCWAACRSIPPLTSFLEADEFAQSMEDLLHCSSAKERTSQHSQLLKTCGTHVTSWRLWPCATWWSCCFPGPAAVCIPTKHRSGGCHHLSHLEKQGSTVRVMFFDFSSTFNTLQSCLLGEKLLVMHLHPDTGFWTTSLTGHSMSKWMTVPMTLWLATPEHLKELYWHHSTSHSQTPQTSYLVPATSISFLMTPPLLDATRSSTEDW